MNPYAQGNLPKTWQPWGFAAVSREERGVYGDSRVFYVQPDHPQATDLGNLGENPLLPLATVNAAVTLARAYHGDTIYVMSSNSWQYSARTETGIVESLIIPATKPGLRIIGVGQGSLGVYWQPAATTEWCITVHALDTIIEGFCFWSGLLASANGIYLDWTGGASALYGENAIIHNCAFEDGIDIGVQLEFSWFNKISECWFDCDDYGIYVDPAGSGSDYNSIHHNLFQDCGAAMGLRGAMHNFVWANSIYNSNAESGALATDEGIDTTGGAENQVYDNYFSCILPAAANGDWNDMNTGDATSAWIHNHCINGEAVSTPT